MKKNILAFALVITMSILTAFAFTTTGNDKKCDKKNCKKENCEKKSHCKKAEAKKTCKYSDEAKKSSCHAAKKADKDA